MVATTPLPAPSAVAPDGLPGSVFRAFMDNSPAIAWLRDDQSRYVFLNKTYLDRYGLKPEDRLGKRPADVWPVDIAAQLLANDRAVLTAGKPLRVLEKCPDPDGSTHVWLNVKFPFTDAQQRQYVGGVGVDVTDEKRAEDERHLLEVRSARAQKIESLGLLAVGAAHDFNNLLTAVIGHVNFARAGIDGSSEAVEHLRAIEDAAQQMADLCKQMLVFAGRGRREPRLVNLNVLAQDTARLLRGMLAPAIAVKFDLAANLPGVFGDETQLRQIVLNLITNAADSLADSSGTIAIRTGVEMPSRAALAEAGCDPGAYAVLEVRDDGEGMPPDVQAKIFEPFFSTKATGRGLGLAAVAGIVRTHRGLIEVESAPGQGATMRVLLPLGTEK